jgi:hypothetical protein
MIEKGANWWDGGLVCACYGGHLDIVQLMIDKGTTYLTHDCPKNINKFIKSV